MKKFIPLFAFMLVLFSVSSFAKKLDVLNSKDVDPSTKLIIGYKIRIIVQEVGNNGSNYDYNVFAYVYDINGNPNSPVAIPSSVTIYGSLTLSGVTSPIAITIPPSGLHTENWTSIPKLDQNNLQANSLSTYSLGGIPISSEQITFQ